MSKGKIYAYYLIETKENGIVHTWEECKKITAGKGARYRSFNDEKEAEIWLSNGAVYEKKNKIEKLFDLIEVLDRDAIYFDAGTGRGQGVEVRLTDYNGNSLFNEILKNSKLNEFGNYYLSKGRTNNYGELVGLYGALKYAEKYDKKIICGDSKLVIEYWSKGRYNLNDLEEETVNLIKKVVLMRVDFEKNGGIIKKISGDINPADLGFHK